MADFFGDVWLWFADRLEDRPRAAAAFFLVCAGGIAAAVALVGV